MEQLSLASIQTQVPNQSFRTPIEIALKVDENNHTTAKALYDFLELRAKDYSRWCKTNITDNAFAEEGKDFWVLRIDAENYQPCGLGGRPSQGYILTAHLAKMISMASKGPKANEARDYFASIEEKVGDVTNVISSLSPELQMCYQLFNGLARQELEQKRQAAEIDKLNSKVESMKDIRLPIADNWRRDISDRLNKIQKASGADIRFIRSDAYNTLEGKARVNLSIRLRNKKMNALEAGVSPSKVDKFNYMDVIEEDPKLKEIFSGIVKDFEAHYCL